MICILILTLSSCHKIAGNYPYISYLDYTIYDNNYLIDVSIIEKDMPRFAEFSKYAFNEFSVKNKMRKYLQTYDLEYLIEKLPWEIYNERKEKYNYE